MYISTVTHRVVVQFSGNQISAAKASELVTVVSSNTGSLPVQVKNVTTGM